MGICFNPKSEIRRNYYIKVPVLNIHIYLQINFIWSTNCVCHFKLYTGYRHWQLAYSIYLITLAPFPSNFFSFLLGFGMHCFVKVISDWQGIVTYILYHFLLNRIPWLLWKKSSDWFMTQNEKVHYQRWPPSDAFLILMS